MTYQTETTLTTEALTHDCLEERLLADKTELLYRAVPQSVWIVIVCAFLLGYILVPAVGQTPVMAWLSLIVCVGGIRLLVWRAYRKAQPGPEVISRWATYIKLTTLLSGLSWGLVPIFLYPEHSVVHQAVIGFVLAGMSGGAVTTLAPMLGALLAYAIPTIAPYGIRLFMQQDEMSLVMGTLVIFSMTMVIIAGHRAAGTIEESLRLRYATRRAEEDLRLAATAFDSNEGIFITNRQGVILRANEAACRITGYSNQELVGKAPNLLRSGRQSTAFYRHMWRHVLELGVWEGELWDRRKNGEIYPTWLSITAVQNKLGEYTHFVGHFQDISQRKQAEEHIQYQAYYDSLTDLPNRRQLHERLEQENARAQRHGSCGAVLLIDLDHFKNVNDSLGHASGDRLLTVMAQRLRSCLRKEDIAARLGGDEFVVVLNDLGKDASEAVTTAHRIADEIRYKLAEPTEIANRQLYITPSMGIALFPNENANAEELIKFADIALYKAKERGRNTLVIYEAGMQERVQHRMTLEEELRKALEHNQLVLHYQPQVDHSGVISGVEALVRWQHPRRGLLGPLEFIPFAEENGLIVPLSRWITSAALRQLREWEGLAQRGGIPRVPIMAINISPREFAQTNFVEGFIAQVEAAGVDPSNIEIEITENLLIANIDDAIDKMQTLSEFGIKLAIDDFGTGYSSMRYLQKLHLHKVKIDRSFVVDIGERAGSNAVVEAIIAMGKSLGLEVVAEGVETVQQLQYLGRLGCLCYQGYYFSRPVDREAIAKLLGQPPRAA